VALTRKSQLSHKFPALECSLKKDSQPEHRLVSTFQHLRSSSRVSVIEPTSKHDLNVWARRTLHYYQNLESQRTHPSLVPLFFSLYLYPSGSVPCLSDCVRSMISIGFFSGELNQRLERENSVVKCSVLPSLFFSLLLSCLLQSTSLTSAFRQLGLNQF